MRLAIVLGASVVRATIRASASAVAGPIGGPIVNDAGPIVYRSVKSDGDVRAAKLLAQLIGR